MLDVSGQAGAFIFVQHKDDVTVTWTVARELTAMCWTCQTNMRTVAALTDICSCMHYNNVTALN